MRRRSPVRPAAETPCRLTFQVDLPDLLSLSFIVFLTMVLVFSRKLLMYFDLGIAYSDPAYHLAVARQVLEQGRVPLWDYWEFAPFGRPHLYPPLLHLLIALFAGEPQRLLAGYSVLQVIVFPLSLAGTWYLARCLLGSLAAFFSVILLSIDTQCILFHLIALPSALVTALMPLILVFFLSRKMLPAVAIMTAALYTHGPFGVPAFILIALAAVSWRRQEYRVFYARMLCFSLLLYLPWLVHMLRFRDWLGMPFDALRLGGALGLGGTVWWRGVVLNPLFLLPSLGAWFSRDQRLGVLKLSLLGFLPMLVAYGGRFLAHTSPLWAILGGWGLAVLVGRVARGRVRVALVGVGFIAATFLQPPLVRFNQADRIEAGFTASQMTGLLQQHRPRPDRAFQRMASFIRRALPPEAVLVPSGPPAPDPGSPGAYSQFEASEVYQRLKDHIVHIGTHEETDAPLYFGDMVSAFTGCRVDTGGWYSEVRNAHMSREATSARENSPHALFAFRRSKGFTDEYVAQLRRKYRLDWTERFGRHYLVGARGIPRPSDVTSDLGMKKVISVSG